MEHYIDTPVRVNGRDCIRRHFASVEECGKARRALARHVLYALPCVLLLDPTVPCDPPGLPVAEHTGVILLSGGHSKRMGTDKAELMFLGTTLMEFQLEKARLCGAAEILLSAGLNDAHRRTEITNVTVVCDDLPDRGPLGGIAACLKHCTCPQCVVLPIDTPLVPAELLIGLARSECDTSIVAVSHNGHTEPLLSRWDAGVWKNIEEAIWEKAMPVRALFARTGITIVASHLPDEIFMNLNTPSDHNSVMPF